MTIDDIKAYRTHEELRLKFESAVMRMEALSRVNVSGKSSLELLELHRLNNDACRTAMSLYSELRLNEAKTDALSRMIDVNRNSGAKSINAAPA